MKKFRMAIIGAGNICQSAHVPAYKKIDDVEIVAVADWKIERARQVAANFPGCKAYETAEQVLANEDIDGVDICVWNRSHEPLAIAAARAGKHALCEKPMAADLEGALRMKRAVEDAGVTFMLAVPRRYQTDVRLLADMVAEGKLGDIYYAKCAMIRRRGTPVGWFTDTTKSGGGPVVDIGVHCIDNTWYLMGRPKPVRVSAQISHAIGNFQTKGVNRWVALDHDVTAFDTEDSAAGIVHFENGACLLFETSWALNCRDQSYTQICGTKGGAELEPLCVYTEEDEYLTDKHPVTINIDRFEYEIRHFVACARTGRKPVSCLEDALTIQRILDAIYRSARENREVSL